MRRYAQLARPQRRSHAARRVPRRAAISRTITRSPRPVFRRNTPLVSRSAPSWSGYRRDPYVDYGRFLTPEGGILIIYKDLDQRLCHALWRVFAWSASTGFEGWLLFFHAQLHDDWIKLACLFTIMAINFFIVARPVEVYRRVEIRPDCMIIEGKDVFWLRMMENGMPTFHPDKDGNQVLSGVYGTRLVEYLTVRRFDELDRMPEVFAAHLKEAMQQLWAAALVRDTAQRGSGPWQGD